MNEEYAYVIMRDDGKFETEYVDFTITDNK